MPTNTYTKAFHNIDLASILGKPTAFVGFTGGTGSFVSTQTTSNFTFTPAPELAAFASLAFGIIRRSALTVRAKRQMA